MDYSIDPLDGVARTICAMADEVDAAAVVMAGHKHSTWVEFMLGSVTNYCSHHCHKPVLVLHPASAGCQAAALPVSDSSS